MEHPVGGPVRVRITLDDKGSVMEVELDDGSTPKTFGRVN